MSRTKTLINQTVMPSIGFGTWRLEDDKETEAIIIEALNQGYRHFDTAAYYQNEQRLGKAFEKAGFERQALYITSKVPSSVKDPKETLKVFEQSLKDLQTDYLDLYLIHGPAPKDQRHESHKFNEGNVLVWQTLEKLYLDGKVKAIGVSNFSLADLTNIRTHAKIMPMVHQIPFYAGLPQTALREDANMTKMLIQAYSPLAKGALIDHPVVLDLAMKYQRTPAQVLIQYCLSMGTVPLPKTKTPHRMQENLASYFSMSQEDIDQLTHLT